MITFANSKSYDKARLAQSKENYYTALGEEISARENQDLLSAASLAVKRQAAENALIDYVDELLSDDLEAQALLQQRRPDLKKQLVELILRLSTK